MAGPTPTTSDHGTATGSTPSSWDCFWHPIDCASATASSVAHDASSSIAADAQGVIGSTTAPLHEVSQTAMWTAIGVAAAAVAIIAIAIVAVYAFHRI